MVKGKEDRAHGNAVSDWSAKGTLTLKILVRNYQPDYHFQNWVRKREGNQFCKQYNHGLCQQARNIKQPQGTPCQIQGHPQSSPKGDCWPALFWSQPRLNSIRPHNYVISDHPYSHVSFSNSILLDFNWTSYAIAYTLRQGDPANCRVIPQVCYIFKIFVQIVIIDNYFDKKLMWYYKLLYMVRPLSWRFYCPNYQQLGREIIIEKHLFS